MFQKLVCLTLLLVPFFTQALPSSDLVAPQTQVLSKGAWRVDLQGELSPTKGEDLAPVSSSKSSFGASYGVFEKSIYAAELGIDWREPQGDSLSKALQLHFRVRVFDYSKNRWSVAFGAQDFGFDSEVNAYNIMYAVFQQKLVNDFDISLGAYSGSSDLLLNSDGEDASQGFILGGARRIQNGQGKFVVQIMGGNNQFSYLHTGFNVLLGDGIKGVLAYSHALDSGYRSWLLFKTQIYY